ncbi:glycoside hydrolase [Meredithblackwellia eburnea MCA 4105]
MANASANASDIGFAQTGAEEKNGGGQHNKRGVSPWLKFGAPIILVVIILAAVLGGVLGSRAANKSNKNAAIGSSDSSSTTSVSSAGGSKSSTTGSATGSSSAPSASASAITGGNVTIAPLKAWDWSTDKAIGMCLGNWLVLERWMDEDWFIGLAGEDAWDEWDFSQNLGANATAALQAHYNSWITEADIELMHTNGINQLRIPTGFWAWIPTVSGEPYVNAGQVAQLERVMGYAHARGMYVVIDLHGLPGSQNGEESSGHNTTSPTWFQSTINQNRSDATVQAVLDFVAKTPYRTVVAGLEVINEPRPYTTTQYQTLSNYYARSYTAIQASAWPIPMFIHGAFITDAMNYWKSFVTARVTNPPSLVYEDHPYPGNFPPQTDSSSIMSQICTDANNYLGYPVPVVITEWSVYTGIKSTSFESQFYEAQLKTWAWSGGSHYWSYRVIPSSLQLKAGLDYSQYSFVSLVQNGTITTPASVGVSNTTTLAGAQSYLDDLTGNCGNAPSNTAPYNTGTVVTWSAEAAALSSAATVTLRATGTAGSRLARHRRVIKP